MFCFEVKWDAYIKFEDFKVQDDQKPIYYANNNNQTNKITISNDIYDRVIFLIN